MTTPEQSPRDRRAAYLALLNAERKLEMAGREVEARAVRQIRRAL
jgi:hypothetical protein